MTKKRESKQGANQQGEKEDKNQAGFERNSIR